MMKMSRRARRMERHHESRKRPAINLVALMDIFTILVIFLLVNSSAVQQLPNKKNIKLPTSIAKKLPRETLVIMVTQRDILVQGRQVTTIQQVLAQDEEFISALKTELRFQAQATIALKPADSENNSKAVTIMGDENISYELLRKVLATCREADYTQIAFAAMQTAVGKDEST